MTLAEPSTHVSARADQSIAPGSPIASVAVAWAASIAACGLALACSPSGGSSTPAVPAPLEGFNVLVIVSDTLRADHLGFHGYARSTSPFLDRLAAEGVVFERATSASSFTRESVSALFTGMLPSLSGSAGWHAAPPDAVPNLGEIYRAAGYRTAFLTSTVMLADERFLAGFDEVDQLSRRHASERPHRKVMNAALTARALEFVAAAPGEPFMAYLHYLDPHAPYNVPAELLTRFTDDVFGDPLSLYGDVRSDLRELRESGFGPGDARFEDLVLRYDAEIASVDEALERLFAGLAEHGVRDRTLIVFTADHGEEFLDHDFVEHGWTLYQETTHVPLVFWAPSALAPARVALPVSLVDLRPTLARLTGVADEHSLGSDALVDGIPLFGEARLPIAARPPVFSELLVPHRSVVRSVIAQRWKLIQNRKLLPPFERSLASRHESLADIAAVADFDTFGPIVGEELYDLALDPTESTNLIEREPARAAELRALLDAHEARARAADPERMDSSVHVPLDDDTLHEIQHLGY